LDTRSAMADDTACSGARDAVSSADDVTRHLLSRRRGD